MSRLTSALGKAIGRLLDLDASMTASGSTVLRRLTYHLLPLIGVIALIAVFSRCALQAYQLRSFDDDATQHLTGSQDLRIAAVLQLSRQAAFPQLADLRLESVTLPPGPLRAATQLCLHDFDLVNDAAPPSHASLAKTIAEAPAMRCAAVADGIAPLDATVSLSTGLVERGSYYKYPFDSFALAPVIHGRLVGAAADGATLYDFAIDDPSWTLGIDAAGWIVTSTETPASPQQPLEFSRALFPQILTVATLAMIVLFSVGILFVDSFSTAVQIALGLVLGIIGVRAVLVPADPPGPLAFDAVIVLLYVLAGASVVLRSAVIKLQQLLVRVDAPAPRRPAGFTEESSTTEREP